jgi:hypothetical protein
MYLVMAKQMPCVLQAEGPSAFPFQDASSPVNLPCTLAFTSFLTTTTTYLQLAAEAGCTRSFLVAASKFTGNQADEGGAISTSASGAFSLSCDPKTWPVLPNASSLFDARSMDQLSSSFGE